MAQKDVYANLKVIGDLEVTGSILVPVITTPTIADLTNANHDHVNAAGGGQLDHGNLLGLGDDTHSAYLLINGVQTVSAASIQNYLEDVADILSTQALTIDLTFASGGGNARTFATYIDVMLGRASTDNIYGYFRGWINWRVNTTGNGIINSYDISHGTSGVDACSLSAISRGIRIVVDSSAFGNTLNNNTVRITTTGTGGPTITTGIA